MNIELTREFFLSRENWKDFIMPSLAIAIPIFITLIITHLDRKTNAKNRLDDLARYEKDKMEMLLEEENQRNATITTKTEIFKDLITKSIFNIEIHLMTLEGLIDKSSFEKLKSLSVAVMVNDYIQALLRFNLSEIDKNFDQKTSLQFLNSIKLIDRMYEEFVEWNNFYRSNYIQNSREFDVALHRLLFEIERLRYDQDFDKLIFQSLDDFKINYDQYVDSYHSITSFSSAKMVSILKENFVTQDFIKLDGKYAYLHNLLLNLEISLLKLERLSENSKLMLNAIKSGLTTHVGVLNKIKQALHNESL
ncbi:hypothetical protein [Sphingobacterium sp. 40-24]|uniref:hypothetical protein n=1 Tax=Sphingobacterium sp. 40-24 TaxID=1895843 RepID=UPI0009610B24|nr:hypothetical protein [Sphingobacterium sp. 40-24]OJZ00035.1 MAG: hypothetical protein BGP15_00065 [Sphingobacterium sp. 40-24]